MDNRPLHTITAKIIASGLIILLVLVTLPVMPARAAAATVTTQDVTGLKRTGVIFNAIVNANGDDTTVTFEYGLDTSYGSTITASPSSVTGTADTNVSSAQIPGLLTPNTAYHYRAVGVNAAGTTFGGDITFTTKPAGSMTYYVNNTIACDNAAGTDPAHPFCTISKGATVADAGDIVRVLAGSYAETVKPSNNGGAGMPIIFSADPGVTVTGRPDSPANATSGGAFRFFNKGYINIIGFTVLGTVDYGIIVTSSHDIAISYNHVGYSGTAISGGLRSGIYLTSTTNSSIVGNITDHNTFDGIRLNNGSNNNWIEQNTSFGNATQIASDAAGIGLFQNSNNNTIIRNIIFSNEDSGLNIYGGSNHNNVINNLAYGNGDHGIDNNGAPFNTFIGNTIQGNVTVGINFEKDVPGNGSGGAIVMNNIFVDNGFRRLVGGGTFFTSNAGSIRVDDASIPGTTLDYDLIYSSPAFTDVQITWGTFIYFSLSAFQAAVPGQEANGLQADPLLLVPAPIAEHPSQAPFNVAINVGNYRLRAGSPAIDSANSNAPNEQAVDLAGNNRVDIPSVPNTGAGTRKYDDRGAYEYQIQAVFETFLPLVFR